MRRILSELARSNSSVTELTLCGSGGSTLSDETVETIGALLRVHVSLTRLELRSFVIDTRSAKCVVQSDNLRSLSLLDCTSIDSLLAGDVKWSRLRSLEELDLGKSIVDAPTFERLVDALAGNTSIRKLALRCDADS